MSTVICTIRIATHNFSAPIMSDRNSSAPKLQHKTESFQKLPPTEFQIKIKSSVAKSALISCN